MPIRKPTLVFRENLLDLAALIHASINHHRRALEFFLYG
jgi:hypothetical protein